MDVINTETKISETEIKLCEIKKDLKPVEDKLMKIKTLESELTTYDLKLEKLKVR